MHVSLMSIKQYMMKVKMTSLAQLCAVFATDIEHMRHLLRHWMAKGKLRVCPKKPSCGTKCQQCPTANIEWYEWVEDLSTV